MSRVTDELARVAEGLFGAEATRAMAVLSTYGHAPHHREPERVRHAILALSEGDFERLRHFLEQADKDYRDVLFWGEYPRDPHEPKTYEQLRRELGLPPDEDV